MKVKIKNSLAILLLIVMMGNVQSISLAAEPIYTVSYNIGAYIGESNYDNLDIAKDNGSLFVGISTPGSPGTGNINLYDFPDEPTEIITPSFNVNFSSDEVYDVEVSEDGQMMLITLSDTANVIRMYNRLGFVWEQSHSTALGGNSMGMSDDGDYVVYEAWDGSCLIYCYYGNNGTLKWQKDYLTVDVKDIEISGDGSLIVVSLNNNTLHSYSPLSNDMLWSLDMVDFEGYLYLSDDGSVICVRNYLTGHGLRFYKYDQSNGFTEQYALTNTHSYLSIPAISADGSNILVSTFNNTNDVFGTLSLYNIESEDPIWTRLVEDSIEHNAISEDGRLGICGGSKRGVFIIDCVNNEIIDHLPYFAGIYSTRVAITSDGSIAYAWGSEGTLIGFNISRLDSSSNIDNSLIDDLIDFFTDMENLIGISIVLVSGLLLGMIIGKKGKKDKKNKR